MKILLFGAQGQVGSALYRLLAGKEGKVVPLTRRDADLKEPQSVDALLQRHAPFDAIINAAAYNAVDMAEDDPLTAMRVNAESPACMAAHCAANAAPLIHFSTDYVFNGRAAAKESYDEEDPPDPVNAYGASKLAGERALLQSDAAALILRLAWVYDHFHANFFTTMLRLARTQKQVSVVKDQVSTPSGAQDIAEATVCVLERLCENPQRFSGLYHYTPRGRASWADFAAAIFSRLAPDTRVSSIPTEAFPTRAQRPRQSVLSTKKFDTAFALPRRSWENVLCRVIASYQSERKTKE